uniref:Uncharacterized protein n=1 Tax=Arundo donax TaxID=35708 RepID=A0A0A9G7I4_ARUDO
MEHTVGQERTSGGGEPGQGGG